MYALSDSIIDTVTIIFRHLLVLPSLDFLSDKLCYVNFFLCLFRAVDGLGIAPIASIKVVFSLTGFTDSHCVGKVKFD